MLRVFLTQVTIEAGFIFLIKNSSGSPTNYPLPTRTTCLPAKSILFSLNIYKHAAGVHGSKLRDGLRAFASSLRQSESLEEQIIFKIDYLSKWGGRGNCV